MMTEDKAKTYINNNPDVYFKKAKTGYVCPLCNNGAGKDGTGMKQYPENSNTYKCFKCSFYGDILAFIAVENSLDCVKDFHQVFEKACLIYGITIDEADGRKQRQLDQIAMKSGNPIKPNPMKRGRLPLEIEETNYCQYYAAANANLNADYARNGKSNYLSLRGICLAVQNMFNVGLDEQWKSPAAVKKGLNPKPSKRVIIPTDDYSYVARDTGVDATLKFLKEGRPAIFNERVLWEDMPQTIFITEGQIDALSFIELGENAIGLPSAADTKKLAAAISQSKQHTYVLCLDRDDAGRKATAEIASSGHIYIDRSSELLGQHKDANEALIADRTELLRNIKAVKDDIGKRTTK
jgi:hypothetical protein